MSEEEASQPTVCENFEPQAWRKTVCKNCFKPPEMHVAGSDKNGVSETSGTSQNNLDGISPADKKRAASSIKDKFEQLEKDKYKPKDASHTLPRTKKASGLSLITDKYDQLDREAGKTGSPTKSIPPPTPPKTYKKDGALKGKFGSMENVSIDNEASDSKLGIKSKFGSMDNISVVPDKKRDPVSTLTQKTKFGISKDSVPAPDIMKDGRHAMLSKLDSFQNEVLSGATSKAGQTIILKQKDGNVDIISVPQKSDSISETKGKSINNSSDKLDSKSKDEKPSSKILLNKDTSLTKIGQALKSDLKPTANDLGKKDELKGAKDLLSSNRLKSTKNDDSKNKPAVRDPKAAMMTVPVLKQAGGEKDGKKPILFKDRLNQTKTEEPKSNSLNLKDQLKSPSVDKDPLAKLKDKLKSPTKEPDNKQAPTWKDRLKSSVDMDKKSDKDKTNGTKAEPELKVKTTSSTEPELKVKTASPTEPELKVKTTSSTEPEMKVKTTSSTEPELKVKTTSSTEPEMKVKTTSSTEPKSLNVDVKSPSGDEKKHVTDSGNKSVSEIDKSQASGTEKKNSSEIGVIEEPTDQSKKQESEPPKTEKDATAKLDGKIKLKTLDKLKGEPETTSQDKNSSNDLKSQLNKASDKKGKENEVVGKSKTFDFKTGLKKATDKAPAEKDSPKTDPKKKFELPSIKSNKTGTNTDKVKDNDAKTNKIDKPDKIANKFEPKFKLNRINEPKSSNSNEEKSVVKNKFELPKLKSKTDTQEEPKSSLKSKFEPKSKSNDTKAETKNKFEVPSLKKTKVQESDQSVVKSDSKKDTLVETKTEEPVKAKSPEPSKDKNDLVENIINSTKDLNETDSKVTLEVTDSDGSKDESATDLTVKSSRENDVKDEATDGIAASNTVNDFQLNNETNKIENRTTDVNEEKRSDSNTPETSVISITPFENISSDNEVISGDACVVKSTHDNKSPLHVDTQVFTSSRSKTAGVSSLDDSSFDDRASGFSELSLDQINKSKSPPKTALVNGDIIVDNFNGIDKKQTEDKDGKISAKHSDSELERLKAELLNMTERCQNLETENEMLRSDLNKKTLTESTARKQKDDVESAINGLKGQLKSMEDKCSQLETENNKMMNDLKAKHENNQNKPCTNKDSEDMDEKLTAKERLMEDLMEENDQLKQEINELKVEMEEMYDSFRDQEAEEFREIQKELEYTAKNCRILQFKLRKMERRNDQTEQDKNQFEERLRKLQNSFQDRDAVSHIHSLEDELRLAKEVSVRLHDELDLLEDRRGKVEEENRHLTELLEQADRKQFRLELEVDKLRDKVVELRQELRMREAGDSNEPKKLNCAEFLALHRETI
ncbi:positive regulation of microtubule motor [Mactra antiquata]